MFPQSYSFQVIGEWEKSSMEKLSLLIDIDILSSFNLDSIHIWELCRALKL